MEPVGHKGCMATESEQAVKHILYFSSQEDAEQAGSYLHEKLKGDVLIENSKVTFCTNR
jgi:hypothetical protein